MFRYNSPAEAARLRRAGVRRASSRLSVLSLSACDLAAARSVESLLTAEKRSLLSPEKRSETLTALTREKVSH